MNHILKYESRKLHIDFTHDLPSFKPVKFDGITFDQKYSKKPNQHCDYQIVLSKKITSREEISSVSEQIAELCRTINSYSTYVIGNPIDTDVKTHRRTQKRMSLFGSVDFWSSNKDELNEQFLKLQEGNRSIIGKISFGSIQHWVKLECSPIPELIHFLKKKDNVRPLIRELVYFHSQSFRHDFDIKYLILSKALEIVKLLLPYENLKKSFNSLPDDIKEVFGNKNLGWLYEMSNFRIETRHAINKKDQTKLHPNFSDEECNDFAYLSDFIISYLIRTEFGLDPVIWQTK